MARTVKPTAPDSVETLSLPPFPSESYTVTLLFDDDTREVIPVMAKGPVRALQTGLYTAERWEVDRQARVVGAAVEKG